MKKLKLSIESLCGIRRLEATLDFSRGGNAAVYASNGTMKSPLAHALKDARDGASPLDRIYDVPCKYRTLRDGKPIAPGSMPVFDHDDTKDEVRTSAGIPVNDRPRAVYNAIISRMAAGAERPDDAAVWFCIPRVAHDLVGADGAQAAGAGMRPAGCSRTPPPRRGPRP